MSALKIRAKQGAIGHKDPAGTHVPGGQAIPTLIIPDDYNAVTDDVMTVIARYNVPVTVNDGGNPANAPYIVGRVGAPLDAVSNWEYAGGSGTTDLLFSRTITAADNDADGIDLSNQIVGGGASIHYNAGVDTASQVFAGYKQVSDTAITAFPGNVVNIPGITINQVPAANPPAQGVLSQAIANNGGATLIFSTQADATGYKLQYKLPSETDYTVAGTTTTANGQITGLINGTIYDFAYTPFNDDGDAPISNVLQATPSSLIVASAMDFNFQSPYNEIESTAFKTFSKVVEQNSRIDTSIEPNYLGFSVKDRQGEVFPQTGEIQGVDYKEGTDLVHDLNRTDGVMNGASGFYFISNLMFRSLGCHIFAISDNDGSKPIIEFVISTGRRFGFKIANNNGTTQNSSTLNWAAYTESNAVDINNFYTLEAFADYSDPDPANKIYQVRVNGVLSPGFNDATRTTPNITLEQHLPFDPQRVAHGNTTEGVKTESFDGVIQRTLFHTGPPSVGYMDEARAQFLSERL